MRELPVEVGFHYFCVTNGSRHGWESRTSNFVNRLLLEMLRLTVGSIPLLFIVVGKLIASLASS